MSNRRSDRESDDPGVIRSIAVTVDDVVTALEANASADRGAVLRVTPPFSGRMRARIHIVTGTDSGPQTLHVDPERLLAPDTPVYPRPADTEDALRADPTEEYTVERHREYHADVVTAWRDRLPDTVKDHVTIETPAGPITVEVSVLG
jgi:hypothetical protein